MLRQPIRRHGGRLHCRAQFSLWIQLSLFNARDVSCESAPQRQKFHSADVKSVQNLVRSTVTPPKWSQPSKWFPPPKWPPITTEMIPAVTTEMIPEISGMELRGLQKLDNNLGVLCIYLYCIFFTECNLPFTALYFAVNWFFFWFNTRQYLFKRCNSLMSSISSNFFLYIYIFARKSS